MLPVQGKSSRESTVENEITTAIDTDSDDSTQTVASTTDVTDVTTEASTTTGSTDISTEATTDATTETTDATDGNAEDETFDVDTIFTSGTFEIAGGGGDPKDSIFQGEVELAQMKMTKVDGTWSPEFWQASGSLGIDLNGLDISGTVDAAYYRAGSTIPGSALTLPDIGSSNEIDASTETDGAVTEQETEETTSTTALTDSASTDSTATIESNTDLETSTDTTTASTESEQTTAEIANDEAFDVDTIFTSGTFEIEGGGGNPKTPSSKEKLSSLR